MKILVCVSSTPDTTAKIGFIDGKEFDRNGVNYIMNPYDEWYALVRAIELKEALGGEVVVVNVGLTVNDIIIRKALAIGADKAMRIDAESPTAEFTAFQIAEYAKTEGFDLILTGKETIDYNGSLVGALIAEHLGKPYISYANSLNVEGSKATVTREIEGGTETIEVDLPLVISAAKGMAEQRIPNMRGIMMAKSKPLVVMPPRPYKNKVEFIGFELPAAKEGVKMIDPEDMDELVRLLNQEAKVI